MSSHGAFDPTNVWYWGRMAGSPSTVPSRIDTSGPSGQVPPNRLEPQTEQNALIEPSSGLYERTRSAPDTREKSFRLTRPCVQTAVPEWRRHREQWQWPALRNSPRTS